MVRLNLPRFKEATTSRFSQDTTALQILFKQHLIFYLEKLHSN